jgi:hypothetical protein
MIKVMVFTLCEPHSYCYDCIHYCVVKFKVLLWRFSLQLHRDVWDKVFVWSMHRGSKFPVESFIGLFLETGLLSLTASYHLWLGLL